MTRGTKRRGVALAALTSLALLAGCMGDLVAPTRGKVALTVKWPTKRAAFTILAIPEGTARIEVSIRGEGIPDAAPLKTTLTPGGQENATEFIDVPIGPKFVEGVGYDAEGKPTAVGGVAIAVQPNALVEARLVLQAVDPVTVAPTPTPTPTPQPTSTPGGGTGEPTPRPTPTPTVEPRFVIETAAGDGVAGALDARYPLTARFKYPRALCYDEARQVLFVADSEFRLIRRMDLASGAVDTIAGRPTVDGSEPAGVPPALAGAAPGVPSGLAVGPDGDLYFCDRDNHMVRKITAEGQLVTVAGTGRAGYIDGAAGQAQFSYPGDLSIDKAGNIYVADTYNNRVRRIAGGQVTTVLGSGEAFVSMQTGLKLAAPSLARPLAVVVEPGGRWFYVAEGQGHKVSRYEVAKGTLTPVVGTGLAGTGGEGGPATAAELSMPTALTLDRDGALLIADGWAVKSGTETLLGAASRVLRVGADGRLVRVAGQINASAYGFSGDGDDPRKGELNNPSGLAVDAGGQLFIADTYNNRLRVVRPLPVTPVEPSPTPTPAPAASATPAPVTTPAPSPAP